MTMIQELLQQLVSFKTTADNSEEIKKGFEYIISLFDVKVFDAKILEKNEKYSLLVSFKTKDALKPKILLNGHFDVVPVEREEDYEMRVEGLKAYGRGTADMKGMVVVLIEVMQELGKNNNPPDVGLLLDGDEEVGGENGAGYVARELGIKPQFLLCADGTHERDEIVIKHKGGVWLELTAQGRGAHAAYLWKGENAIEKLLGAVEKIKEFVGPMEAGAWKSTLNVACIETSNTTPNKVPSDAKAILDIRFTEELAKTPDELVEKITKLVPEVAVTPLTKNSLLLVDENNPFLQRFKSVADRVSGVQIPLKFGHGATDARYFAEVGIPGVIFGGIGANFHADGEWVDLESLEQQKQILLEFLQRT